MTHLVGDVPADLVLVGGPPFFGPTSSVQRSMARAWREERGRVLYLELGGDGRPYRAQRARAGREPVKASDGLFVLRLRRAPGLPWSYPDALRRFNLWRNRRSIRRAIAAGLSGRGFLALYYGWFWPEWVGRLGAAIDVYDCIDEHRAYPHVARHTGYVWACERRMLGRVDLLVATSPVLLEDRGAIARRQIWLPNAADVANWAPDPDRVPVEPADLEGLPRPRLVLIGHLRSKLDLAAVEHLADAHPDWGVFLIGPIRRGTVLRPARPNLRWVGVKPYDELPAYLAHADVGLLPLRPTPFNRASCPLKLLEYLAAGLPVAASSIPATERWARTLPEFVHLADEADDFPAACEAALSAAGRFPRARIASAVRDNSWNNRVREMVKAVRALR